MSSRLASDLIWADPATDETELLSGMSPGQQNFGRGVRLDAGQSFILFYLPLHFMRILLTI